MNNGIIEINSDKEFGSGDDGVYFRATSACCLKFKKDDGLQILDRIYVMCVTEGNVNIIAEEGVIVNSTGNKIKPNCFSLFVKIGYNEWDELTGNLIN